MNPLEKALVIPFSFSEDMCKYCTATKEDGLGKMLREIVALLKISVLGERIQDQKCEC